MKNIVAFMECENGVVRYGVECLLDVPFGTETVTFSGKFSAQFLGEYLTSIPTLTQAARPPSTPLPPSDHPLMMFSGRAQTGLLSFAFQTPHIHLSDMVLHLDVTAEEMLPARMTMTASMMIQNGGVGGGVAVCCQSTVFFIIDDLPNALVVGEVENVELARIVQVLLPQGSAGDAESASSVIHDIAGVAQKISIERAIVAFNSTGSAQRTEDFEPFPPGLTLRLRRAKVDLFSLHHEISAWKIREQGSTNHPNVLSEAMIEDSERLTAIAHCSPMYDITGDVTMTELHEARGGLQPSHIPSSSCVQPRNSARFFLEGSLQLNQPIHLGPLLFFSRSARNGAPPLGLRLILAEEPTRYIIPHAAGVNVVSLKELKLVPLHRRDFIGLHRCTVHSNDADLDVDVLDIRPPCPGGASPSALRLSTTFLSVPPSTITSPDDVALCVGKNNKYFYFELQWETEPSARSSLEQGLLRVTHSNLNTFQKCGVAEVLRAMIESMLWNHQRMTEEKLSATTAAIDDLQQRSEQRERIGAQLHEETSVVDSDIHSLRQALLRMHSERHRLLKRCMSIRSLANSMEPRDRCHDREGLDSSCDVPYAQHRCSLNVLRWGTKRSLVRRSRFASHLIGLYHQKSAMELLIRSALVVLRRRQAQAQRMRATAADCLEREAVVFSTLQKNLQSLRQKKDHLESHLLLLSRDLPAFASLLDISSLSIEGRSTVPGHPLSTPMPHHLAAMETVQLSLLLEGTVRHLPLCSTIPLRSLLHDDVSSALQHAARLILRLIILTQPESIE